MDELEELFKKLGENSDSQSTQEEQPQRSSEAESVSQPEVVPKEEPVYQASEEPKPVYEQPPVQNSGYYYGSTQNNVNQNTQGGFYQAPVYPQQNQNYYSPNPQQSVPQNQFEQVTYPEAEPPKKKKGKALIWIVIVIILCAAVGFGGILMSINSENGGSLLNSDETTTQSQNGGTNDDSASATISDSDYEAATKDSEGNLTVAGVVEKTKDSCVGITVYTTQSAYSYFYNYGSSSNSGEKVASGEGSGVIMSASNGKTYIMTCAHVIEDGTSFTVTLDDDTEYEAKMVGYDTQTDIGVLSIDATGLQIPVFGNSDNIKVGEECIAIGCPGGLTFKNSVTKGIISGLDVPVSSSIGYNNECIQVDAAINPGNSGGALFNMNGEVIGINSSKIAATDYEGMGFAVPIITALDTANSLIKNGYVAGRAKIGIQYNTLASYQSASTIVEALAEKGYKNAEGAMVIQSIDSDSDLNNSDVQQYDMIVAIDGETITSTDVVSSVLSKKKPGQTVTLSIARIENNSIKVFKVKCKLVESK